MATEDKIYTINQIKMRISPILKNTGLKVPLCLVLTVRGVQLKEVTLICLSIVDCGD